MKIKLKNSIIKNLEYLENDLENLEIIEEFILKLKNVNDHNKSVENARIMINKTKKWC